MAVTATTVWEVWSTGAATNGGGFDSSVSVPGTDFSQQSGSQKTYTDMVIGAVDSTTATSVGNPFGATDVGNVYNVTSGTGFTVQRVVLLSVTGVIGTFSTSLGTTSSTGGHATMGGSLSTLTGPSLVAGNTVWVKATGTYSLSATAAIFTGNGTATAPISHIGYSSVRGDNGQVTVSRSSGSSTSLLSGAGTFRRIRNFIVDGTSGTAISGISMTGADGIIDNCKVIDCTAAGISAGASKIIIANTFVNNCSGTAGINVIAAGAHLINCVVAGNTTHGVVINAASSSDFSVLEGCICANNAGAGITGLKVNNSQTARINGCAFYGNGGDGILFDTSASATAGDGAAIFNCIIVNNGGFGVNSNTTNYGSTVGWFADGYNAYGNNTSGARNNIPTGVGDVALSGDPFVNGASSNFALNSTAGAGASCRAAGFPGVLQTGGTGFIDIGALQHQDSGGSAGPFSRIFAGF